MPKWRFFLKNPTLHKTSERTIKTTIGTTMETTNVDVVTTEAIWTNGRRTEMTTSCLCTGNENKSEALTIWRPEMASEEVASAEEEEEEEVGVVKLTNT